MGIEQIDFSYQKELERIHRIWELWSATTVEKIDFLNFAIQVIGNDIQYQHFAQLFYEQIANNLLVQKLIPIDRVAVARNIHKHFPLDNHLIFTIPYDLKKIRDAGRDIDREGYRPDQQDNVDGFYIQEFNAVFLVNGRHHIMAARTKCTSCFAKSIEEYSLEDAFSNLSVSTYGRTWLFKDIYSKQESQVNVIDPRIALMYDLAKERHLIQKTSLPTPGLPTGTTTM